MISAALYKALANNDEEQISVITKTAKRFFDKIGYVFIGYIVALVLIYPYFVRQTFSAGYTISLLLVISISTLTRYLLGLIYRILIQADQKIYFTNIVESIIVVLNAVVVIVLIKNHVPIQVEKLASALIFSVSSLVYYFYVKSKYHLQKDCQYNNDLIKDRWSAFGHHVAASIHFNTDPIILTLFSTVKEVSVYSIYALIVSRSKRSHF